MRDGLRTIPADWSHLSRSQLKRALRLACRLPRVPQTRWMVNMSTGEHFEVTSDRVKAIEAAMHGLGIRALRIFPQRGQTSGPSPAKDYRQRLLDSLSSGDTDNIRRLRFWIKTRILTGKLRFKHKRKMNWGG